MQLFLRVLISVFLLVSTPFGASAEGYRVRDIRKVVVGGDGSVPTPVLKRIDRHLQRAARATRRTVRIDRAAMDVRVSGVVQGGDGHSSARVTVTISDLKGGASSRDTLTVNSFMPGRKGREAALGDAIATRVALAYHLAPVATGRIDGKHPGKRRHHAGGRRKPAVRHEVRTYARNENRPLVIPTESALTVRSRALPEGSTKKVAPCVVTQTISCD